MAGIKKKLKKILPEKVVRYYKKTSSFLMHLKNKDRSASEVFSEIYFKNLWGGGGGEFYSGPGSGDEYTQKYCEMVNSFIKSLNVENIHVIDVGCGDFRVGGKIAGKNNIIYTGVDVVCELIERNRNKYGKENIKFACLDASKEDLPEGDICLIRQVLQHLSNSEIKNILEKLKKYKYVFVTESHPVKLENYNKDKTHGQGMRLFEGSGVYLDKPPFNIFGDIYMVMSIPCDSETNIETFLIKN